jgi:hypothetical protein
VGEAAEAAEMAEEICCPRASRVSLSLRERLRFDCEGENLGEDAVMADRFSFEEDGLATRGEVSWWCFLL